MIEDARDARYPYDEYVKQMYQKGYYVYHYSIDTMSHEVYSVDNKILILPIALDGENVTYVFTGIKQKLATYSDPTEFKLYLEDDKGNEFKDNDNIMMSLIRPDDTIDLFTRGYASWKYGISFERGVHLEQDKYLMFQTQKDIGKFDIEICNVDLFRRKNKIEKRHQRMMWLD